MVLGILPHGNFSPFAEINFLYTQILDSVLVSEVETILFCLGAVIFLRTYDDTEEIIYNLNLAYFDEMFHLKPEGIEHLLVDFSVLDS